MFKAIATEAIKYQVNDAIKPVLRDIIDRIYKDIDTGAYRNNKELIASGYGDEIELAIKKRFGLTVVPSALLSPISPMAIFPFSSDMMNETSIGSVDRKAIKQIDNVEVEKIYKEVDRIVKEKKETAKKINNKKGTMDFKRAYVTGYMAEVRHHLIANFFMCRKGFNLTADETAAIIVHEIGHAFEGLGNHYKLVTMNQSISKVMACLNENDVDKATYVFRSEFGPEELNAAKLTNKSDRNDFYGELAKKYVRVMDSQYIRSRPDHTSFEYLADSFATNLGYGVDITTALKKMYGHYYVGAHKWRWWSEITFTFNIYLVICGLAAGTPFSVFFTMFLVSMNLWVTYLMNKNPAIYDNFKDRNSRVSREIVHAIKTDGMPPEETRNLIDQWELINVVNEDTVNWETISSRVMKLLVPSFRSDDKALKEQQAVEELLNNPLFIKSATVGLQ